MKKILGCLLFLALGSAEAQDYRTGNQALVAGVTGYISLAESPARVTTSTSTARTATAVPAYSFVRILCNQDTNFRVGDSGVNAVTSDPYVVGSNPEVFNTGSGTYIAFIAAASGTCDVSVLR